MHFSAPYPLISLDTIANSASYFSGRWNPDLKRNQSQQLLTLLLNKFYWPTRANIFRGNPFHAKVQASHAALGASLALSRPWVCQLVAKLREAGWITTYAPRKPNGKYQEITIFRPGGKLKKLLVTLLKSHQRPQNHISTTVNGHEQKIPTSKIPPHEVEKNLQFLRDLQEDLAKKRDMRQLLTPKRHHN